MAPGTHTGPGWNGPHNHLLADITPRVPDEYIGYLLGKHVALLGASTTGTTFSVPTPLWELILHYDQQIRKLQMKKMREGKSYGAALREAWSDPVCKERSFSTPRLFGTA